MDVTSLILVAYETPALPLFRSQIIGAPDWLQSTRYDITAKVSNDLAPETPAELFSKMPMLLRSLLQERFKLAIHRDTRNQPVYELRVKNAALGPHMRPSTARCPEERDRCSLRFQTGHVSGGAMTMQSLVSILSGRVERVVVDRTGLAGPFDVDLEWSPDQLNTDKPSIFEAVQEELGLTLDATRAPVDVLVIDHIERPTPD